MSIPEDFRESILTFARTSYSPGEEEPISHCMVKSNEGRITMIAFTCDVDPVSRTNAIRECCSKPGIVLAAHIFEAFGIHEKDRTQENLRRYGPMFENWPDQLRLESVNIIIESIGGSYEYWHASIQNDDLGEFMKSGDARGRMMGFFPKLSTLN